MGTAYHFGYVEEHLYVFRETFTGNGAATTFQLTGNVGNATFETGSWTVVNVETAMASDASKTTGAALYDSLLPLVRHKITVSSISATGLVTLNYAPLAENFYIWYWYDMEGDAIQDYYRDDYVSSMEADAGVTIASGITLDTAAFAGQLSVADDTVQKAMDTLDDHYHSNIFGVLKEPTGFANRTGSALAFADGTLTLTVTVVSGSYTYWINAVPYVISGTKTLPIADTEGTHVIYFDTDSALHEYVNPTAAQYLTVMISKAIVATIYWDATNKQSVFFGEERHGCVMDGYTHEYLHYTRGLQYVSGMDLADFTIGDGSLDAHAQFSISSGSVADEDIGLTTGAKATATGLPILYRSGATGVWRKVTQTGFVCYQNPLGTTNRLMWNENTGATWQLTEVTESDFVIYHIFATTGYSQQLVSIPGQAEYATLAAARTGATTEMNALLLGDLPALEMRPVASIIFQTDKDYGNTINARVVEVQSGGDDYVDWRSTDLPRGTAAFDSSLYVRVDGSAALSANWDAGSFKITAETFASDVATGTAPLTIASATLVTNLNVDQVDSLHAQTLTATSPITLSGVTSVLAAAGITIAHAATAGNVHVPTAGATGQILIYGGASGTAAWTTATYPATTTAFKLPVSTATNVVGELAAVGATGEYLAGATGAIPAWATLNQAAVAGLTTGSSPEFVTVKLSGLTDGYVPYHVSDAAGLANGPIWTDGTKVGIGTATVPHGAVGAAMLAIDGANASVNGPHLQFTTASDDYPTMQILNWAHGTQLILFDSFFDGSDYHASHTFQAGIRKYGTCLEIFCDAVTVNSNLIFPSSFWFENIGIGSLTLGGASRTMQLLTYADDNMGVVFDAYWQGAWKSSHAGSNFCFYKFQNYFRFRYASGVAVGGAVTWTDALVFDVSGNVGLSATSPVCRLEVEDAATTASMLVKITQDDGTVYGLIIGNDTSSTVDTNGLAFLVADAGDVGIYCHDSATDASLLIDVDNILYFRQTGGTTKFKLSLALTYTLLELGVEDSNGAALYLYGRATGQAYGGLADFHTSADHDTTITHYRITAYEDDLWIGPSNDEDALKLDALKDLYITAGSLLIAASEYINFGTTQGDGGYGIKDNGGDVEYKDSGGAWTALNTLGGGGAFSADSLKPYFLL